MGGGLGDGWGGAAAGEASWDSRPTPSTSTAREASSPHAKLILTSVVLPFGTCVMLPRISWGDFPSFEKLKLKLKVPLARHSF